jgi:hypothetical protein
MRSLPTGFSTKVVLVTLLGAGLLGCSSSTDGDPAATGGTSTAGAPGTSQAGTGSPGPTGGSPQATAGQSSGGATGASGTPSSFSGSSATGGTASSGAAGTASGGATGSGGVSGGGGASGGQSSGGAASGGAASGDCVKGQTKGNQVAVIGESFIAASHGITKQIESDAKAAGSLAQGESYVDKSVSGKLLSGTDPDAIPAQYAKAKQGGAIKYVLMDGGGNDCLQANNGDAALAAAQTLFQTMATDKVEKVQYFFYPDPLGSFASGTLKTCLDALRPKMKALCDGLTAPKCYWLDLRPVWNGHSEYTSDGIHPTPAGDKVTGDAIWEEMKKNCIAQ